MILPELSARVQAQVRRAYGLSSSAAFVPLHTSQNRTFKVLNPDWNHPAVVRLYRSTWKTPEAIRAELNVLSFIDHNSDLLVPCPLPNIQKELLTTVKDQDTVVKIAMFRYIEGESATRLTRSHVLELGAALARLDQVLLEADAAISPRPSSVRLVWNHETLIDWSLEHLLAVRGAHPFLNGIDRPNAELPPVQEVADRLRGHFLSVFNSLPKQLIHADATLENIRFNEEGVSILDFDEIGYGARAYELTSPLCSPLFLSTSTPLASTLVAGYCQQLPLADVELQSLPLLVAVRLFGSMGWAAARTDIAWTRRLMENGVVRLRHILALLNVFEQQGSALVVEPIYFDIDYDRWRGAR